MKAEKPSEKLRARQQARPAKEERVLRRGDRAVDAWLASYRDELARLAIRGMRLPRAAVPALDDILRRMANDGSLLMHQLLSDMWGWAWPNVTGDWIASVPMRYWVRRVTPVDRLAVEINTATGRQNAVSAGVALLEQLPLPSPIDVEIGLQQVIDGTAKGAEAREIIRRIEFPSPTPRQVERILSATNAEDGLSAMRRIKTVIKPDLLKVRRMMVAAFSAPQEEYASAVQGLFPQLRSVFAKYPRGPEKGPWQTINYKARRIARTEGRRVAAAAAEEAADQVDDLIGAKIIRTSEDANVRDEHRARWWPAKTYRKIGPGRYQAADGEMWPGPGPWGPNCRCTSEDVLDDELIAGGVVPDKPDESWSKKETKQIDWAVQQSLSPKAVEKLAAQLRLDSVRKAAFFRRIDKLQSAKRHQAKLARLKGQKEWQDYAAKYKYRFEGRHRETLSRLADKIASDPDWEAEFTHVGSSYFRHKPTGKRLRISDHPSVGYQGQLADIKIDPRNLGKATSVIADKVDQ